MRIIMSKRDILKKLGISLITLLCLTALLLFIFRDNLEDISAAFMKLSPADILWLFILGISYQMLDGLACWFLVRTSVPAFPYHQALAFVYLGIFGRTSTFGAGTIPMRAYYLHRCGIDVGQGVGIMTFSYVLHKVTVVIYVSVLLLAERNWFRSAIPNLHSYLITGYLICLAVVCLLMLLCSWHRAHESALWLTGKLPNTEKWSGIKHKIQQQLDCLYHATAVYLKNKKAVLKAVFTNVIKLGILCAVPYICMNISGTNVISFTHTELLTALVLLLASAVPNVAGIGPTEAAFYLIYSPLIGSVITTSSLLLFRIATYYFPFFVSVIVFLVVQARLLSNGKSEEVQ